MDALLPFRDRAEAGRHLAVALARFRGSRPLILAIPRGAVPMARIIADALEGDLDVILVRKLGAPGNPEFAIGAIDENGEAMLDDRAVEWSGADRNYLRREAETQLALERDQLFLELAIDVDHRPLALRQFKTSPGNDSFTFLRQHLDRRQPGPLVLGHVCPQSMSLGRWMPSR